MKAGSEKWAAVKSPQALPANEDVIRLAFIYQPSKVKPVGDSKIISGHEAFTGTAREPLLLRNSRRSVLTAALRVKSFVAVANHFKVKGVSRIRRIRISTRAITTSSDQAGCGRAQLGRKEYAGKALFFIGDFNAYGAEDPIREFTRNGYTDLGAEYAPDKQTYQFSEVTLARWITFSPTLRLKSSL